MGAKLLSKGDAVEAVAFVLVFMGNEKKTTEMLNVCPGLEDVGQ